MSSILDCSKNIRYQIKNWKNKKNKLHYGITNISRVAHDKDFQVEHDHRLEVIFVEDLLPVGMDEIQEKIIGWLLDERAPI